MRLFHGLLIAGSFLLLAGGVYWSLPPRHSINEQNIARIQPGMSQREVECLLGGPPGDYGPESVATESHGVIIPLPSEKVETWFAGYVAVSVRFAEDGKVVDVQSMARLVGEETWIEKARRWLGFAQGDIR